MKNKSEQDKIKETGKGPAQKERSRTVTYTAILVLGALLAMEIQLFPNFGPAYVLGPWIYLPCFLYVSRNMRGKTQVAIWLVFWVGSFMVRYRGIMDPFSKGVSIALTLIGALVYAMAFAIDRLTYNKGSRVVSVLMFPCVFASIDYILELLTLGSLFSLGQTQFDNKPLLQLCSVVGSKGIVFLLALSASVIICCRKNRKRITLWLLVILAIHGCGLIRIARQTPKIEAADTVTVGWSGQPIEDESFFANGSDGSVELNMEALTEALDAAKAKGVDFLCFPEESFYLLDENYDTFLEVAEDLAYEYEINLLLPIEVDYEEEDLEFDINECILINSEGKLIGDYIKSMLIPIAEEPYYQSGQEILPDAQVQIGDKELNLSYAICFDGDFSSYIRTMANDIDLFFDVSWDWPQVDDLHYRIIGLRAVENGITFVKPTICGYTTVTDYLGNIHSITHSDDTGYEGVNVLQLPTAKCTTIYHQIGKWIDMAYLMGLAVLLILLLVIRGNAMEKSKKPLTRFGEFEFLKALAIMGLPLVHLMEEAMEANMASSALLSFGNAIIGLCAFGPSVFMICMGFGIGGGKTSADAVRRTGIQFLLIGAILNVVRWLIPGIIQMIVVHTPLIEDVKFCLQSDIYYFAGIFFIFYSFMKQWKITTPQILLISIISLTINNMLTPAIQKVVTNAVVGSIVGNIIYVDETSCFPLLSWMIFPTVGILLGEVLKKNTDEFREVFMRRLLDFSLVFFGAFVFFLWNYKIDVLKVIVSPANKYITDLPNVLALLALALFLIGLTYYLCKVIGSSKFMAFMLKISAFIIPFYLLQWVIIAWIFYGTTIFNVPDGSFGIAAYVLSAIIITGLCIYVASEHGMKIMKVLIKYTYFKKKRKKGGKKGGKKGDKKGDKKEEKKLKKGEKKEKKGDKDNEK